jgi:hypothetical protein
MKRKELLLMVLVFGVAVLGAIILVGLASIFMSAYDETKYFLAVAGGAYTPANLALDGAVIGGTFDVYNSETGELIAKNIQIANWYGADRLTTLPFADYPFYIQLTYASIRTGGDSRDPNCKEPEKYPNCGQLTSRSLTQEELSKMRLDCRITGVYAGEVSYIDSISNCNVKPESNTFLKGKVTDKKSSPIEGVKISFGNEISYSDAQGNYQLGFLGGMSETLIAEKEGYKPYSTKISASNKLQKTQNIILEKNTLSIWEQIKQFFEKFWNNLKNVFR